MKTIQIFVVIIVVVVTNGESKIPASEYLPPMEEVLESAPAEEPTPSHSLSNDGYQYKTIRRIRYRHRREAPQIPENEYLPPEEASGNVPIADEPTPAHSLANDGYQYKTVRRIRYRHRREAL